MKLRDIVIGLGALVVAGLGYGGWLAWNAHLNLVSLNVRNMPVRDVVSKIEWQTWETVVVDNAVQGNVTLRVRRRQLGEVLGMIAGQTAAQPAMIYPLYSSGASLVNLRKALRGEVDPMTHGWTNIQQRGLGGPMMAFGPGGGGFGGPGGPMLVMAGPGGPAPGPDRTHGVSLNILGKDLGFAVTALERFAQARVVPEDGTAGMVTLVVKQATPSAVVAKLAGNVHRKWARVFALRAGFGPGRGPGGPGGPRGPGGFGGPPQMFVMAGTNRPPRGFGEPGDPNGGPNPEMAARFEEMRKQREAREQELLQALPADERQKLEQAQQERQKQMEELQNMTPEQRRDAFARMNGGGRMDQANRERILNSTPEQRAAMTARMNMGGGGMRGPGGPGGPGGQGGGGRGGPY